MISYDISQRIEFLNLPSEVKSELSATPLLLNDLALLYLKCPPKAHLLKRCSPVWYYWEVLQPSRGGTGQSSLGHWWHAFERDYGTWVISYSQLLPDQENKFYYAEFPLPVLRSNAWWVTNWTLKLWVKKQNKWKLSLLIMLGVYSSNWEITY